MQVCERTCLWDAGEHQNFLDNQDSSRRSTLNYVKLKSLCTAKETQESKKTGYAWRKHSPGILQTEN